MRAAGMCVTSAAAVGFVVLLLSVPVFTEMKDQWEVTCNPSHIVAPKRSTAEINCIYDYPYITHPSARVRDTFWFTKGILNNLRDDWEYSGRVNYHCDKNNCTLRITDLRESDSANYKFRFITDIPEGLYTGEPGVRLLVIDPGFEVLVRRSSVSVTLVCHKTGGLSFFPARYDYEWYKNRVRVQGQQEKELHLASFDSADSYECSINGNLVHSPPVYRPKHPSVSVNSSSEIMEGSSVSVTCSSDANPPAEITWFKKGNDQTSQKFSKKLQLIFRSIQPSDSGWYHCTAENMLGSTSEDIMIDVKYPPKRLSVSASPSAEIVEGGSVNLTCSSDANPAATCSWYNESQTLLQGHHGIYLFTSVRSADSQSYTCNCVNPYGKQSASQFIDVQYPPRHLSVSASPSADLVEGGPVNLTCSSDANPAANFIWFRDNNDSPEASGQILSITDVRAEHSGNYRCEARNTRGSKNATVTLTVSLVLWKKAVSGAALVFLAIVLLSSFLLMRKRKTSEQSPESEERPGNGEQHQSEEEVSPQYSVVSFVKNQADPIYSNITSAGPCRVQEEVVEYAVVTFNSSPQ